MTPSVTTATGQPPPEPWLTRTWRYDELVRAGWPGDLAVDVADSDADLHVACELVKKGCPPERALEILL